MSAWKPIIPMTTPSQSMVERVARALCEGAVRKGVGLDWTQQIDRTSEGRVLELVERSWRLYVADARAALTAMLDGGLIERAYTEGMWAGWRSGLAGEQMDDVCAQQAWQRSDTAITAALSEGEGEGDGYP